MSFNLEWVWYMYIVADYHMHGQIKLTGWNLYCTTDWLADVKVYLFSTVWFHVNMHVSKNLPAPSRYLTVYQETRRLSEYPIKLLRSKISIVRRGRCRPLIILFLSLVASPQAHQTITFSESQSCMCQISWPCSQVSTAFVTHSEKHSRSCGRGLGMKLVDVLVLAKSGC